MTKQHITTDVVIIGGGVVGTSVARELSRYQVDCWLVEQEAEVGWGQTKANSGIVHAGFHDKPGTLKAQYCLEGNRLYPSLCADLDVSFIQNGILMVARNEEERAILDQYYQQGLEHGIPGLTLLSRDEVLAKEPNLQEGVTAALLAPEGGVVAPFELASALMENALQNGGHLLTDNPVEQIEKTAEDLRVITPSTVFSCQYVVNAAGLYSDRIARMVGDDFFRIQPRKGEEYLLDKSASDLVSHTVFPVPNANSKGILVIPTSEGNLMIGPTGDDIVDKEDVTTTDQGFARILAAANTLVKGLDQRKIIAQFSGVRAACDRKEFIIEHSPQCPRLVHLAGIESPGLTAAPAIARRTVELLVDAGMALREKPDFQPKRRPVIRFHSLSRAQQDALVRKDPRYGRMVCRCETVTEGEVVDAIRRGARTLDGVKFRVRAGSGRCQGGFCQPLVMQILARELGIPINDVTKRGGATHQLLHRAKELIPNGEVQHEQATG